MAKLNYLNAGCGNKFHPDWYNIDMTSNSPDVLAANLLNGIPFPDNRFDVVYHSQVLEHFPKEKAAGFLKECYRVLKPNGIIRVVVPDLENIVNEYTKLLKENIEHPDEMSSANYDWIMLELYDQTVRNYSGGHMAEYLQQPHLINERYVLDRMGYVGRKIREEYLTGKGGAGNLRRAFSSLKMFTKAVRYVFRTTLRSQTSNIGAFRLGGEIHQWMYDRYSLSRLLKECGFVNISIKNPVESNIPKWNEYELDVKDGLIYDPTSLYMEARKESTHNIV